MDTLTRPNYIRQHDIVDRARLALPLSIVGAGAIGSFTALILGKLGYAGPVAVYDPDTVSPENLPNQFYPLGSVDRRKVNALSDTLLDWTGLEIAAECVRLEAAPPSPAVLVAVDSMDTRIMLWRTRSPRTRFWYDGRMGAELMRLYTVDTSNPAAVAAYEHTLYTSAQAVPLPCTGRTVIYNVAVIAGLLANQVKRSQAGEAYRFELVLDLRTLTLLVSDATPATR